VQWFELQHHGEFRRAAQLVLNDMSGDFRRQSEGKSHRFMKSVLGYLFNRPLDGRGAVRLGRRRIGLQYTGQDEIKRRNGLARGDAAATGCQHPRAQGKSADQQFAN
jgi:hypothetical protein